MKIVGLIVEYNPFHNGHLYHLNKAKEMYKDSIIIAVMSGNFTQRGDVSLIDKWDKTKIALFYGIDLVVELPFHYATQSADIFAKGAIEILKELKVDTIVFGSELGNALRLKELAEKSLYSDNSNIKKYLDMGYSYPKAIDKSLELNINTPNDILGIAYIKEIMVQNTSIIPIAIKRTNDFHSEKLEKISSATSIRKALKNNENVYLSVPEYTKGFLKDIYMIEDYFNLLKYKIITSKDLSKYQTVDEGIENRIKKYIHTSNNLDELINNIKTKRYTYNKIKRMLLHILVGFTKLDALEYSNINYIRVLGYSSLGQKHLNRIKKDTNIPIITNYRKFKDILNLDYRSSNIYYIYNNKISNELNNPIKKE